MKSFYLNSLIAILYFTSSMATYAVLPSNVDTTYANLKNEEYPIKYLSGKILIKFKTDSDILLMNKKNQLSSLQSVYSKSILNVEEPFNKFFDDRFEDKYGITRIREIEISSDIDPLVFAIQLSQNPDVEYAEPIYERYTSDFIPNDIYYSQLWWTKVIGIEKAWDITQGSEDILIGIVDSGTFTNHEDLSDNIWINPSEIANNNIDDDENGYIDDVSGWDFVGNFSGGNFIPDNNPQPSNGAVMHGTHVAGCAAAVGNNSKGVVGPGFKCKILPIKVGSDNPQVTGIYKGYEGILYAAKMGADIINCSWGGQGFSETEQTIINQAIAYGAVIIAAAGNDSKNMSYYSQYPAMLDKVISIGASRVGDKVASFSNYGYHNCVYAPGENIYSTMPGDTYAGQNGTSMASPITSGVAALIKTLHPTWNWKQIYHQLRSTSDNVFAGTNESQRLNYFGRVNAYKALTYNNDNEALQVAGVSIDSFNVGANSSSFKQYGESDLKIKLTNYLSKAKLLKITITPMDDFIKVATKDFTINDMENLQSRDIETKVELLKTNPWFMGSAKLLIKYEATGYVDYEVLELPIEIPTTNSFRYAAGIPNYLYPIINNAYATDNSAWFVGNSQSYGRGLFTIIGSNVAMNITNNNEMLTAVYAIDAKTAYLASNSGSKAEILFTNNSCNSFTRYDVSAITTFVNDIQFIDNKYGVFIGDPKNGKFGIGYSTDAGVTWKAVTQSPIANTEESSLVGASTWYGNYCWFGTNKGRIFYSDSRGQSWKVATLETGTTISKIAMITNKLGIAIYGSATSKTKIASTFDGVNWSKNQFDFSTLGQIPVHCFTVNDTSKTNTDVFVVTHESRVYRSKDYGKTWTPILAQQTPPITIAVESKDIPNEKLRIWGASNYIGYLDCSYANPIFKLVSLTDSIIQFDSCIVGKVSTKNVILENAGNQILYIDTIYFENQEEIFDIAYGKLNTLTPGSKMNLKVRFNPKDIKEYTGKLFIKSDIQNFEYLLKGKGLDPSSINELSKYGIKTIEISPNPADDYFTISIESEIYGICQLEIINLNGDISDSQTLDLSLGTNYKKINSNTLQNGTYILKISYNNESTYQKIVISR